jgi:hypothetical protein
MKKVLNTAIGYRFDDLNHLKIFFELQSHSKVSLIDYINEDELLSDFTIHGEFNKDNKLIPFTVFYLKDRKGLIYVTETILS